MFARPRFFRAPRTDSTCLPYGGNACPGSILHFSSLAVARSLGRRNVSDHLACATLLLTGLSVVMLRVLIDPKRRKQAGFLQAHQSIKGGNTDVP
jgi:hypothetical protein